MKKSIKIFTFLALALFACANVSCTVSAAAETCAVTSVRAAHILVPSKEEADALKLRVSKGESFEALAKEYSKCPSSSEGGDLGYFERGQMVKSFEDAAFTLPVGKVSEPVRTQFGWHLIKVYDKK